MRPALRYSYYPLEAIALSSVVPPGGPVAGGTPLTLSGSGFPPAAAAAVAHLAGLVGCRVGAALVPATRTAHGEITCTSPAARDAEPALDTSAAAATPLPVCVTFNGDAGATACGGSGLVLFHVLNASVTLSITSIYPLAGPADGGTNVSIRGRLLPLPSAHAHAAVCRFGDASPVLVPAVGRAGVGGEEDEVTWLSPLLEEGRAPSVRVAVSPTGGADAMTVDEDEAGGSAWFTYYT